ncbi:MAG: hypothetical protein LUH40_04940, partial [Clostridiales bacterium]|nr:hypothetical protein [Clostridiales bacterium]
MANSKSRESDFMSWLSGKVSPAQLSELYWCYREIDSVFMKGGLLSKPLFETTDIETIRAVQKKIETSKIFRVRNSKNYAKLVAAGRYYLEYSESISEETETADTQPEVGEQADASNTAAERPKEAAKSDAPVQSEKTARPSTTFNRSSFYSYLQIVLKKPAETAKTYCDYISFCELIAQNYNLSSQRLYTSDYDESKATADALVENEEFIQYNNRLKNSLRVAITWLLTFICESEKDVKPSTAVQPEKTEQPATPAQPEKIEQNENKNQTEKNIKPSP